VNGPLVVDEVELMVRAAIDGVGLAFVSDDRTGTTSRAVHLFGCWKIGAAVPGFFLYYPSRRQQPPRFPP